MPLPDPTAAALVEWIEARGNESGPLFHRLIKGDRSIATGADSRIARQEQGESTWDPLNASELAPNSANGLIPSLIAWAKSQPPGNVAIVSIKVRFLAGSSLISLAEGSRRGGDLVRVVAEEAVAQVPAFDLLRDGLRLIDLVIGQGGTRLTEQGAGVLAIMGQ